MEHDPDAKALSKRIHEVKQATSAYDSKDNPQLWCDRLLSHAHMHKLQWANLIDHIKIFFENYSDEQVKIWFDSYRDCIREQQKANVSSDDIWEGLRSELISTFDLSQRTRKAKLELNADMYSNESADEYINKVCDLTRKVHGRATEQYIVKNLYDHLPSSLKSHLGLGPRHTGNSDFRLGFTKLVDSFQLQKRRKPITPSLALPALEEEEPQKHYARNFRRPYSPYCSFCQRGPHKEKECFNMQSVVVKLMGLDPKLTPQRAYDDLIMGIPSDSSAIKAFRDDPDS